MGTAQEDPTYRMGYHDGFVGIERCKFEINNDLYRRGYDDGDYQFRHFSKNDSTETLAHRKGFVSGGK